MTDYRKILMLRSMGCSQREMERNKIASRETSKAVFETADRLGICWPLDDDITNADLERLLFPNKYKNACLYVEPIKILIVFQKLIHHFSHHNWHSFSAFLAALS